jgi:hypothetical protein
MPTLLGVEAQTFRVATGLLLVLAIAHVFLKAKVTLVMVDVVGTFVMPRILLSTGPKVAMGLVPVAALVCT